MEATTLPTPDNNPTHNAGFPLLFRLGITVLFLGTLSIALSMIGYSFWAEHAARKVLEGPAVGADAIYYDTAHSFDRLGRLAAEVHETRSPGSFLRALDQWADALDPQTKRKSAQWVTDLKAKQRDEVLTRLAKQKITPEQILNLQSKMRKISPQMSDSETAVLDQLTSFTGMMDLAMIQMETSKSLFSKLHDLGARDVGLAQLDMRNWTADLP